MGRLSNARRGETGDQRFAGVRIGHWTDAEARTGCTVVLFDGPTPLVLDVRGGSPGTRETDLFARGRRVQRADAILLTGGSAFGLAAADGVVRELARRERGFPTPAGPVPIVPAAVIYDLGVGQPLAPDAAAGEAACRAAGPLTAAQRGQVGAGTGATTGKLTGASGSFRGGVGLGQVTWTGGGIAALVVVNAFGDVVDPITGYRVALPGAQLFDRRAEIVAGSGFAASPGTSTTLAVVLVDVACDHDTLQRCAVAAHDGMARAIHPCHTVFDGDIAFAAALRPATDLTDPVLTLRLGVATELAVEAAILDAVTAQPSGESEGVRR